MNQSHESWGPDDVKGQTWTWRSLIQQCNRASFHFLFYTMPSISLVPFWKVRIKIIPFFFFFSLLWLISVLSQPVLFWGYIYESMIKNTISHPRHNWAERGFSVAMARLRYSSWYVTNNLVFPLTSVMALGCFWSVINGSFSYGEKTKMLSESSIRIVLSTKEQSSLTNKARGSFP